MKKTKIVQCVVHFFLLIFAFLTFYPLIFTLITSLKDNEQFYQSFWNLPDPIIWSNYGEAFHSLMPYIGNSFLVAGISILILLITSSLAAYAFARLRFPFKEQLFILVLVLLMIPGLLQLIPRFMMLNNLHLLDTYAGIIVGYVTTGQAMAIFIIRSFFDSQPEELFEAARIDGAGEIRAFVSIALPLIKPVLGTVAIINLLNIWNDYLWPLIVTSDESKFIMSLGLLKYNSSFGQNVLYGPMFAGYIVASLPLIILFLIFMDYFMEGLTAGAVKM